MLYAALLLQDFELPCGIYDLWGTDLRSYKSFLRQDIIKIISKITFTDLEHTAICQTIHNLSVRCLFFSQSVLKQYIVNSEICFTVIIISYQNDQF